MRLQNWFAFLILVLAIAATGCKPENPLVGTWQSHDITITLSPDQTYSIETGSVEKEAGKWSAKGNTVDLEVKTLGGKPVDQALANGLTGAKKQFKMTASQEAAAITSSKEAFARLGFLTVSPDGKSLTCAEFTPDTVFYKPGTKPKVDLAADDQIKEHLRLGMGTGEVATYFGAHEFSAITTPADPTLLIETIELEDAAPEPTTVKAYYRMVKGKPELESIEIVKGSFRRKIPLGK